MSRTPTDVPHSAYLDLNSICGWTWLNVQENENISLSVSTPIQFLMGESHVT